MELNKFFQEVESSDIIKCLYVEPEDINEDVEVSRMCKEDATHKTRRVYVKTINLPHVREDGEYLGDLGDITHDLYLPEDNMYSLGSRAIRVCEEHREPLLKLWYDNIEE